MKIANLIGLDTIILQLKSERKDEVLEELIYKFYKANRLYDLKEFKRQVFEGQENTGLMAYGVAIISVNTEDVRRTSIVFARSKKGIDFNSLDGRKTKIFFLLGTTKGSEDEHKQILEKLTAYAKDEKFSQKLLKSFTREEILETIYKKDGE